MTGCKLDIDESKTEIQYKDADKLLTVLTRDFGKMTLKARGVKGKNSPLKAACQLLAFSEFTVFEYRGFITINEAVPKELFLPLHSDLVREQADSER